MATKALNFKLDEDEILDIKKVASVFNISVTDLIKNAIEEYVSVLKKDPFYRLTENVQDADEEENTEILEEIDRLTEDDLEIVSSEKIITG